MGSLLLCRTIQKAKELCNLLGNGAESASLDDVSSGHVTGDILINSTSIGMEPDTEATPVLRDALQSYRLVFDAVYTPIETSLLQVILPFTLMQPSSIFPWSSTPSVQLKVFSVNRYPPCTETSYFAPRV